MATMCSALLCRSVTGSTPRNDPSCPYRAIEALDRVLGIARVSKTVRPVFVSARQVLNEKIVVFPTNRYVDFGVLSSSLHWHWAVRHGTTLRSDPQYTPSLVFETFPLPSANEVVAAAAKEFDVHRSKLMIDRHLGLTSVYNLVHDPRPMATISHAP